MIEKESLSENNVNIPMDLKLKMKERDLINSFNFNLTGDQTKVLDEILLDMSSSSPMSRLVQGDVGCGKTAVAFASCNIVIKKGFQAAMAPTESLATQLFINAKTIFRKTKISNFLQEVQKAKKKDIIITNLSKGEVDLVIGTHALIQENVSFGKLGLSIIDEQHKFGVKQRIALNKKSKTGHTIIMSATPIPRSLSLTKFGDLEVSIIREKPNGRKSIPSRSLQKQ